MANSFIYVSQGESLTGIANKLNCHVSDISLSRSARGMINENQDINDYLSGANKVPSGTKLLINKSSDNTYMTNFDSLEVSAQAMISENQSIFDYESQFSTNNIESKNSTSVIESKESVINWSFSSKNSVSSRFVILTGGSRVYSCSLPIYPNEFSETNSAEFSSVSPLGRSVSYKVYNSSSRSLSLVLNLHEELCENKDYKKLGKVVSALESACYPDYGNSYEVKPPEVIFYIANFKSIRGVISSISTTWKAPIIDGRLVNCDVSFTIEETSGPFSRSQIASMKGLRVN